MVNHVSCNFTSPAVPSHHYVDIDTDDEVSHSAALPGWDCVYQNAGGGQFRGRMSHLSLGVIELIHEVVYQPMVFQGEARKGSKLFYTYESLGSSGSTESGSRHAENPTLKVPTAVTENTIVTLPFDRNIRAFSNGALESWGILIARGCLLGSGDIRLSSDVLEGCDPIIRNAAVVSRFKACVESILSEVSANPAIVNSNDYQRGVNRRVTQILIDCLGCTRTDTDDLPQPSTRTYIVDKALQYLEENLANPLGLEDICQSLRICPRTLRYSFEEVLGVSPSKYILGKRLSGVHQELLHPRSRRLIHCIAHRYGFTHMGRFANFYKQAFGELPSETCARQAHSAGTVQVGSYPRNA